MADLGDLIGSLMSGVIRARRMADEQTAVLAEYYRENPLLEGLSVPRLRIPELTIDVPVIIEKHKEGELGVIEDPRKIVAEAIAQLELTSSENNIKIDVNFKKTFAEEVKKQLPTGKESETLIMKETVVRCVDIAFTEAVKKTEATLTASEKKIIMVDLRKKISTVSFSKQPVSSSIIANIRTADIKEQASGTSVVHLKITLKEEGLEWAIHASESGGVLRTLQPE